MKRAAASRARASSRARRVTRCYPQRRGDKLWRASRHVCHSRWFFLLKSGGSLGYKVELSVDPPLSANWLPRVCARTLQRAGRRSFLVPRSSPPPPLMPKSSFDNRARENYRDFSSERSNLSYVFVEPLSPFFLLSLFLSLSLSESSSGIPGSLRRCIRE